MLFRQVTHDELGCASYLVGDQHAAVAAVVDPRFELDVSLDLARYMGVRIEHILETHNHADHVSGHGRLALATGARSSIAPAASSTACATACSRCPTAARSGPATSAARCAGAPGWT